MKETDRGGKYLRLLKSTAILTFGTLLSKVLVFLLLPLYTSYLTKAEYSTADLIANLANFLIPIFSLGISEGILRFALEESGGGSDSHKAVFSASFLIFLLGSAAVFAVLPLISSYTFLGEYGYLIVAYVIMSNLHSLVAEYVRARGKTALYAGQGVLNTFTVILLNILFLTAFHLGVTGYVLSVVVADFTTSLFLIGKERLWRELDCKAPSGKLYKALLRFSLPLIPTGILFWIINVSDRYILRYYHGDDLNGLYVAAAKIPTLLTLACTVFLTAWKTSAVTEADGEDEESRAEKGRFYGETYGAFLSLLFFAAGGLILLSDPLARILFAEAFHPAFRYIPVLVIGTVFYSISRFLGSIYFVKKLSFRSAATALLASGINIVLNFLLIPSYGAFGAAIATLASYFVEYLIRDLDTQRHLRFTPHRLKILLSSLLIALEGLIITLDRPFAILFALIPLGLLFLLHLSSFCTLLRGFLSILKRGSKKVYK